MTAKFASALFVSIIAAVACASPTSSTAAEPEADFLFGRIVLVPLNLAVRTPEELKGTDEVVWNEIANYFQTHDRSLSTISRADAEFLWMESIAEMEQSGDALDLEVASSRFARRLSEHTDYDFLLMPSLVLRSARVQGGRVSWDGIRRRLPVRESPMYGRVADTLPAEIQIDKWGLNGNVSGASLHVTLLTSGGRSVYEGLAGLDVIHEAARDHEAPREEWQLVLRQQPLSDLEHLRHGIALAFERRPPAMIWSR